MDELDKSRKTLGIKLLYYGNIIDGYRDITDSIGTTDATHLSGTIPHFHVRVTNFQVRQKADSKLLKYTIECEVTG